MSDARLGPRLHDRLSGETFSLLDEETTLPETLLREECPGGRWIFLAGEQDEGYGLDGFPLEGGDPILGDATGASWRLDRRGELLGEGIAYPATRSEEGGELGPDEVAVLTLDELLASGEATWADWIGQPPIAPDAEERFEILPLEETLAEELPHLESICLRPVAHLEVETERVPVGRARRIPWRAHDDLASRSQDWNRSLLDGVEAKRILSERRVERIDIYENRVAARLVDHLCRHLGKRIQPLRQLDRSLGHSVVDGNEIGGSRWRQKRIYAIWGEVVRNGEGRSARERLGRRLRILEDALRRLRALLDSPLYRAVPRRAQVEATLRPSNLLAKDQRYLHLARLWRCWTTRQGARGQDPEQLVRRRRRACRAHERFGLLLVLRALRQLGYASIGESPLLGGTERWTFELASEHDERDRISIAWDGSLGEIELTHDERSLAIVSLAENLGRSIHQPSLFEPLRIACARRAAPVLLLHATSEEETARRDGATSPLHAVGNDPTVDQSFARLAMVPVSPFELDSTERVARALRWFILAPLLGEHPHAVSLTPSASDALKRRLSDMPRRIGESIRLDEAGSRVLIPVPPESPWEAERAFESFLARESERVAILRDEVAARKKAVDGLKGGHRDQKRKDMRRRQADVDLDRTKRDAEALGELKDGLYRILRRSARMLRCPVCGTRVSRKASFEDWHDRGFRCICDDCGCSWGRQTCPRGHAIPFLRADGEIPPLRDRKVGWESQVFGQDQLSLVDPHDERGLRFLCPVCGERS